MSSYIKFLGGCSEVGANSFYINLSGIGIIVDSGLHPKNRTVDAFPKFELLENEPVDYLFITHSHIDHIGAIPYLLKFYPHVKIYCSEPTYYLIDIMLRDSFKLLESDLALYFNNDMLNLFTPEILEKITYLLHPIKYSQTVELKSLITNSIVKAEIFSAGHILGASSIAFSYENKNILFTGDINFSKQFIISGAEIPKIHYSYIVCEATSAGSQPIDKKVQSKLFAAYINKVLNEGGSVLIPVFALGKTQEILRLIYELMYKGSIPTVPIYSGGMSRKISNVYDKFCYNEQMIHQGFEISDIQTISLNREDIKSGKFYRESSIILASSGMLNAGSFAYLLAIEWIKRRNFGIAFVGYQDEDSPGYALLNSESDKKFNFGKNEVIRKCSIDKFRFSSHSNFDDIASFIEDSKPETVFIVHGSSPDSAVDIISDRYTLANLIVPNISDKYYI